MKVTITDCKLSADEREVLINIYQDGDSMVAVIDTSIAKYATKCRRQGWKEIEQVQYIDGTWVSSVFKAPAKAISIGKAERVKRNFTDEQKQAAAERMRTIAKRHSSADDISG